MMRATRFLVKKEFLQIVRDRATLAQLLLIPFVQLIVLANAATFTIRDTHVVVVDQDRSTTSAALATRLEGGGQFRVERVTASAADAERDLIERRASMVVSIPARFEEDLVRAHAAPLQLSVNAEEGAVAGLTIGYAQQIIADFARDQSATLAVVANDVGGPGGGAARSRAGQLAVRTQSWFNVTRNYKHYMVPAILVSLVTIIGTLVTAQNVARERELGTLEQLNVTPLSRTAFFAGKMIPAWLTAMALFCVGLAAGRLLFGIPLRGPVWVVILAAGVYLTVALGIGLFVSTITRTQQQTMFVAFFILMIYLLMSGMFTPLESMPVWAQYVGSATPVRHLVWVMRAVLVRGGDLGTVWREIAGLGLAGVGVMALAVRMYHKTSE
ncbi:MAG TPA: ABC transporter permease [Gemmatimonadaceae bacterium]|nr:ABC transporter permease [Gemmatimonadaceae bacterium]